MNLLRVIGGCFCVGCGWFWGDAAAAELLAGLHRLAGQAGGTAFSCLLRCTGLTLLTDYTRSLCEEAGAESLGWCVGLAGRCLILAAAWPLLEEIGQRIWSIAG